MNHQKTNNRKTWTILKILQWTKDYFQEHQVESPRASAEILLADVLGIRRIDLYLKYDQPLLDTELAKFKASIKRRVKKEPVSYVVGVKEFWSLDFHVTSDVLIPRPETECLVEEALKIESGLEAGRPLRILDAGTGSGAVVVSLAHEKPNHFYFASDRSLKALAIARKNAVQHGMAERIHFLCGDWCAPLKTVPFFDLIISNPPYIRTGDLVDLQPEITEFEPCLALDGDKDGLKCLRRLIRAAPDHLLPGGHLILEMGWDQRQDVEAIASESGFYGSHETVKDYSGRDRIFRLQKKQ